MFKVIPAIDLMEGRVVRLVKGDPANKTVYSDDPVGMAKQWEKKGADRIHVVDLDATIYYKNDNNGGENIASVRLQHKNNFDTIRRIAQSVSIPVQAAGGLRSVEKIEAALEFADKVVLGTFALKNTDSLRDIVRKYDKKRIVISLDHRGGKVAIGGWKDNTDVELKNAVDSFGKDGFDEFLVTSIDRDGTLSGHDLYYLEQACSVENAKIIASGGLSSLGDAKEIRQRGAFGIILGKALYDGKITINGVKSI